MDFVRNLFEKNVNNEIAHVYICIRVYTKGILEKKEKIV